MTLQKQTTKKMAEIKYFKTSLLSIFLDALHDTAAKIS